MNKPVKRISEPAAKAKAPGKASTTPAKTGAAKKAAPKKAQSRLAAEKKAAAVAAARLTESVAEASPAEPTAAETQLQVLRAETAYLRQRLIESEEQLARLKATIGYRLGMTLMETRSFKSMLRLPSRLMALRSDAQEKRRAAPEGAAGRKPEKAAKAVSSQVGRRAAGLTAKAKELRSTDLAEAVRLGLEAVELEPKGYRLKWLASLMYDAGMLDQPTALLERAWEIGEPFTPEQAARLETLRGLVRVRRDGIAIPERAARSAYKPQAKSVAYVAASSLPHHVSGYTLRTHNLIRALGREGWKVAALTRPGYPWDRADAVKVENDRLDYAVDDVAYRRLEGLGSNRTALDQYVATAADSIGAGLRASRPSLVHAASNYVNALPALIAARRAGVPFVYEVRGLWEFTAAQRSATGEQGERFELMRDLEILVSREADAVLAINESLKSELVSRGVDASKISLAPNSVDLEQFQPLPRDVDLQRTLGLKDRYILGFVGSIVDYEGLDEAVEALSLLNRSGLNVSLLLVGGGGAEPAVREKAEAMGLTGKVIFAGRVSPKTVQRYYSIIDLAVFPRKPLAVNEIVSPLKPLEAMAMEKPVLASNVAALAEMIRHEDTGLLFQKGDPSAMATAVSRIMRDPDLSTRLGRNGRRFVEAERTWGATAAQVTQAYASVLGDHG